MPSFKIFQEIMSNHHPPDIHLVVALVQRIFPSGSSCVEQIQEGGSTYVYQIQHDRNTFYLRILPEADASFGPEMLVHNRLRQMGLNVPEVMYFEPCDEILGLSVMLTTEIPGKAVSRSPELSPAQLETILFEAGRELARINSLKVEGFGWIERQSSDISRLSAERTTHRSFIVEHWQSDLAYLKQSVLQPRDITRLEIILARYGGWLDSEQAYLAHGDFDLTHIFQAEGRFSGIIDFGEIRGTDRWYDLGAFHLNDGLWQPSRLFPALTCGYQTVHPFPSDGQQHVRFMSIMITVRMLSHLLQTRPANRFTVHYEKRLQEDLAELLSDG